MRPSRLAALALVLTAPALADDAPAVPSEPAPEADPADPPAKEPEPAAPAAATIAVGPIESVAYKERVQLKGLALDTCLEAPQLPVTSAPGGGQLVLEVVLRRGKASVVTVASVDPGLEWLTPCLKRELAAYEWPVKQGKLAVPVTVTSTTEEAGK